MGVERPVDNLDDLVGRAARDECFAWGCGHVGPPVPRFETAPDTAHELARFRPNRRRVDRGRRERRVPEHRGDAVAVLKSPGAGLRPLNAGGAHERCHLPVRRLPGDGPQCTSRAPCARRTRCTSSRACNPSGTGTARQCSVRRFRVAIRTSFASRSTSHARMASASDTRHPVIARVRARVWTPGFGCTRAAARKRSRSFAVRYFRPRASTRENVPSVMDRKSYITSRVMTSAARALPSPRPLTRGLRNIPTEDRAKNDVHFGIKRELAGENPREFEIVNTRPAAASGT